MIKGSPVLLALLFSAGCANGPARWAEDLAERLECGMTVEQVQRLSIRPLEAMEVPRDWMTHFIGDNATDLWLGFDQGKLRWSQVAWAARMMKMATYQRIDHCGGQSLSSSRITDITTSASARVRLTAGMLWGQL